MNPWPYSSTKPLHLTYCLNIHPGETWSENFAAIREKTLAVKEQVAPKSAFGLGLRLSQQAASELASSEARTGVKQFFANQNLYAFTINGFPFGRFHKDRVKEQVYAPDWRTPERREYTKLLADILADFLPDNIDGSISTVPCSFKPWITSETDVQTMAQMLIDCARHLDGIRQHTGKEIHLGLEPEPCCFLETTEETVRFFEETLFSMARGDEDVVRRHVGVCFDTCHVALQFEDLTESLQRYLAAGIRISKIQLSAALRAPSTPEARSALQPFCEPVYFHQVKAQTESDGVVSWDDLPEALRDLPERKDVRELRVHFHVPLFAEHFGALLSTNASLTPEFFALVQSGLTSHIEIETYTFDVLPAERRRGDVIQSITDEYNWVLPRLTSG